MRSADLTALVTVPLFGVLLCIAPSISRPGLHFGVRVPAGHDGAAVIAAQHQAYRRRAIAVVLCCTAAAIALRGHGPWWLTRIVLLLEVCADLGCFWLARRKITAVKAAEGWFTGVRQAVVADTSWRTAPERFPLRWLLPAIAVIAVTAVTGAIRYPDLPARLGSALGRLDPHGAPRSPASVFAVVIAQVYVTGMGAGLLALAYRSRPDIDPASPEASARQYRAAVRAVGRAVLVLLALTDASLLLVALSYWQILRLSGLEAVLIEVPFAAGLVFLAVTMARATRTGAPGRLASAAGRPGAGVTGRDDDRLWKAGLIYVSRADPAVVVPARVGFGWTLNFGNRIAWLVVAAIVLVPAGLGAIMVSAGG
jgi:uncharacterized membrane protein